MRVTNFLIGLLVTIVLSACSKEEVQLPERIRAVKTVVVAERASGQMRTFAGTVEPVDKSTLSFEVSGLVQSISVEAGDAVKQGEVLAVLDKQPFELNLESAKAALSQTRAQLEEKRAAFERERRIQEQDADATSAKAVEQARAAYESKREGVNYGQAQVVLAKRDLKNTELRAPVDGTISERHVEPHEEIHRGLAVLSVFVEGAMEVAVGVPENMIGGVYPDLLGEVQLPTRPDQPYLAVVTEVGSIATSANAFTVKARIRDVDDNVKPGMTAELTLAFSSEEIKASYLLPVQAIAPGAGADERFVYVFDSATSTVKKTQVATLGLVGDQIMVADGVGPGDIVVVAGVTFLRDGQTVKLMHPAQSES